MEKIVNIEWDIDIDEAYEILDDMRAEDAGNALGIPYDTYANMTTAERHDYAYDLWHRSPASLNEFMELPDEVEIDTDEWSKEREEDWNSLPDVDKNEDITNYLSDTYGFCVKEWLFEGELKEKTA